MNPTEQSLTEFIDSHVAVVSELYKKLCLVYFEASISGKVEDYDEVSRLEIALEKVYTSREEFAKIKEFIASGSVGDPLLKRQLEILFLSYQGSQADEKKLEAIIHLQTQIEKKFATFRAEVQGKKCTDNEIKKILTDSKSSNEVQEARLASKTVSNEVADDVIKIVKMRNEIARELGYRNYHDMHLTLGEQDPKDISALFEELDVLTRDAFIAEKKNIDAYLAKKFQISEEELMPRHYEDRFFQEAPKIYPIDLNSYYHGKDVVELAKKYYTSIGFSIDSILTRSDLYEKEGKSQHAYCLHDKLGDVRILANIKDNGYWMNTQLHELGHAVYDKHLDYEHTPYLLRDAAHTFVTEAIAMLFGRFSSHPQWIQDVVGIGDEEKNKITESCIATLRLEQLVVSRRMQVMYHFEKRLYDNPDQDLNALWRDLVEKYQMLKRPAGRNAPDWASKIHITSSPCYYHNYLLGEVLASQLYYHIVGNVLKSSEYTMQSFYNKPEVGEYLKKHVFTHANKYHWSTMIEMSTGEKLTAKRYAKQFIG